MLRDLNSELEYKIEMFLCFHAFLHSSAYSFFFFITFSHFYSLLSSLLEEENLEWVLTWYMSLLIQCRGVVECIAMQHKIAISKSEGPLKTAQDLEIKKAILNTRIICLLCSSTKTFTCCIYLHVPSKSWNAGKPS